MGTMTYGEKITVDLDDSSLFFLDSLLLELEGRPFQLHLFPRGVHDGNLLSLRIDGGVPLALEYLNTTDLNIDFADVLRATHDVREGRFISLPRGGGGA